MSDHAPRPVGWQRLPALVLLIGIAAADTHSASAAKPTTWKSQAATHCVEVAAPRGPEDLVAVPGQKAILVSSARRGLLTRKPRGQIARIDLSACNAEHLEKGCGGAPDPIYPVEGVSNERISPVGIAMGLAADGHALYFVQFARTRHRKEGTVRRLRLDREGWPIADHDVEVLGGCGALGQPGCPLTGSLNGIGVSATGDVLVSNARAEPPLAWRSAEGDSWHGLAVPRLAFANGIVLPPWRAATAEGDPIPDIALALVADFLRGVIHLIEIRDPRSSPVTAVPRCSFPSIGLPDNLHWSEGREGERLLVGTWGGLSASVFYFLHLSANVPAFAWEVDVGGLGRRLARGDTLPADCGIGVAHWDLLARDERSEVLKGATAVARVGDLLVVGQLRRSRILVCAMPSKGES